MYVQAFSWSSLLLSVVCVLLHYVKLQAHGVGSVSHVDVAPFSLVFLPIQSAWRVG